jgi:hypothetical protein
MQQIMRLSISIMLVLMGIAVAASLGGVSMPNTIESNGKTLALNGMGIREATVLKVNVYVIGLYLEQKSADAQQIIKSSQVKHAKMQFVREVEAAKVREGWDGGFQKNYPNLPAVKSDVQKFLSVMGNMKTGDTLVFDWIDTRFILSINGTQKLSIDNKDFQEAVLSVWLGPNPPNPGLKKGILGQ